jgi:hypothetical protein
MYVTRRLRQRGDVVLEIAAKSYQNSAPRCGAKTRRRTKCQAPVMANGRCRMHGGPSTGPRTTEGTGALATCSLETWGFTPPRFWQNKSVGASC